MLIWETTWILKYVLDDPDVIKVLNAFNQLFATDNLWETVEWWDSKSEKRIHEIKKIDSRYPEIIYLWDGVFSHYSWVNFDVSDLTTSRINSRIRAFIANANYDFIKKNDINTQKIWWKVYYIHMYTDRIEIIPEWEFIQWFLENKDLDQAFASWNATNHVLQDLYDRRSPQIDADLELINRLLIDGLNPKIEGKIISWDIGELFGEVRRTWKLKKDSLPSGILRFLLSERELKIDLPD
jgi:hypothetical protein